MKTALMVLLAIASIILIAAVLLQPSHSDGLSGSIAGGVKTTTVFVLLCVAFRSSQDKGNLSLWRRDISQETVEKASVIVMRSLLFVFIVVLLLLIAEADARVKEYKETHEGWL